MEINHHCFKRVSLQTKNSVVIRNRKLDSNVQIISTKIKNNRLKHKTAVGD